MVTTNATDKSTKEMSRAVAKATAEVIALDQDIKGISAKQLRSQLKKSLGDSGVLNNVKSQLRKEFIGNMLDGSKKMPGGSLSKRETMSLPTRIVYSCIYHLLKQRKLVHSLSVYSAEVGFDAKSAILTEEDVVKALNLGADSPVYQAVVKNVDSSSTSTEEGVRRNVLDLLIENTYRLSNNNRVDMAIQTDRYATDPREELDSHLSQIRNTYMARLEAESERPQSSIEERMLQYQKDCDDRAKKDVEIQLNMFRENELVKARVEASQNARLELEAQKLSMQSDYMRKMEAHSHHESEIVRSNAERDSRYQRDMYDLRQNMQREIQDVRARELATGRKFEVEQQGLKMLELQLKDIQNVLDGRERELVTREKALENRQRDGIERAREQARSDLKTELDAVMRDRRANMLEKQRLSEESSANAAAIQSLEQTRDQVRDLSVELETKEHDLLKLRKVIAKQEAIIKGDIDDPDSHRSEMMDLVRRNTELEQRMPFLEKQSEDYGNQVASRERAEGIAEAQKNEIVRLESSYHVATQEAEQRRERIEELKKDLGEEKMKVVSFELKVQELERLLNEKRKVIATLNTGKGSAYGNFGDDSEGRNNYRDIKQRYAYKKAEEFANALIANRRNMNSGAGATSMPFPPMNTATQNAGAQPPVAPTEAITIQQQQLLQEAIQLEQVRFERQQQLLRGEQHLKNMELETENARLEAEKMELQRRRDEERENRVNMGPIGGPDLSTYMAQQSRGVADHINDEYEKLAQEKKKWMEEQHRIQAEQDRKNAKMVEEMQRSQSTLDQMQELRASFEKERADFSARQNMPAPTASDSYASNLSVNISATSPAQHSSSLNVSAPSESSSFANPIVSFQSPQIKTQNASSDGTHESTGSPYRPILEGTHTVDASPLNPVSTSSMQREGVVDSKAADSVRPIATNTAPTSTYADKAQIQAQTKASPEKSDTTASSSTNEEKQKTDEDAARFAEARRKVLERRKNKMARDMADSAKMSGEVEKEKVEVKSQPIAVPIPSTSTTNNNNSLSFIRQEDSDVEITAGDISGNNSDNNSDGW